MVVTQTADRLFAHEAERCVLRTSCTSIDGLLAGGVRCEEVTEFCGIPGSGKTQFGMQMAVCAQLPVVCGGLGGTCIILDIVAGCGSSCDCHADTEGSVIPSRAATIAVHLLDAVQQQQQHANATQDARVSLDSILDGIHVCRIHGAHELVAACVALGSQIPPTVCCRTRDAVLHGRDSRPLMPLWCCQQLQVKLIVVDSVAAPFRSQQLQHQAVMLESIATALRQVAALGVAVVVMNHVVGTSGEGSEGIKPALGTVWAPQPTHRLLLSIEDSERHARIIKSAWLSPQRCKYVISDQGVSSGSEDASHAAQGDGHQSLEDLRAAC